jgi:hypothetical protein
MPFIHNVVIVPTSYGLGPHRIRQRHKPIAGVVDESLADQPAQRDEVVLAIAFVHHEEHLGVVERHDSLSGDIVRVPGADTDDVDGAHPRRLAARGAPLLSSTAGIDYLWHRT